MDDLAGTFKAPIRFAIIDSVLTAMILPATKSRILAIVVLGFLVGNFLLWLSARHINARVTKGAGARDVRLESAALLAWTIAAPIVIWSIVLVFEWPPPSQLWILLAAVAIVVVWQVGNNVDKRRASSNKGKPSE